MDTQNIRYLNKTRLIKRVKTLNDTYWNATWEGRWKYMWVAINELRVLNPQTILELGAYKINLTDISDNMDLNLKYIDRKNLKNKIYIQDATSLPWDIEDKYYDVFIGLQVFEHFKNKKQSEVFNEIMRISKNAILSFPYKWNTPNNITHHNIDDEIIRKWTNNIMPVKIKEINAPKHRRRIIYIFKF
jgi:hypothetical protein